MYDSPAADSAREATRSLALDSSRPLIFIFVHLERVGWSDFQDSLKVSQNIHHLICVRELLPPHLISSHLIVSRKR